MSEEHLTPHQLIQRILRCVEELERAHVLESSQALLVRSTMVSARSRLLMKHGHWPGDYPLQPTGTDDLSQLSLPDKEMRP